ncbi:MAG: hypothetical protein M3271_10700, partial [Actinomycetota bacterium]|nr:hypothetical protein [Actinomycetota bacterium]
MASTRSPLKGGRDGNGARTWNRSSLRVKGLILIAIPLLPLVAVLSTFLLQAREDERTDVRIT